MYRPTQDQPALQARATELPDTYVKAPAAETDRTDLYPWDVIEKLTEAGFMGMTVPEEYGGQGCSYLDVVLVIEQMARNCGVTARIMVEANIGGIGAIMVYRSEPQKKMGAPFVPNGGKPAICITKPDAASAATEMATTAIKVDGGYKINGIKHWITGGSVSRLYLIFARMIKDGVDQGIGGFIAVRDEDEGLIVGARERSMGLRGIPEVVMHFEDLFVADDRAVMLPQGYRKGFAALMNAYNAQRVRAATVAHGIALSASQALIYKAPSGKGGQFSGMNEAAQAKIFASESAVKVTSDALQIHGAMGYSRNLPLERMYRDARIFTIGGGTAQMLRNKVAGHLLGMKLPQTRDGFAKIAAPTLAAE